MYKKKIRGILYVYVCVYYRDVFYVSYKKIRTLGFNKRIKLEIFQADDIESKDKFQSPHFTFFYTFSCTT